MTTHKEALTLALEALENPDGLDEYNRSISDNAITAIKEALAQPAVAEQHKQEPVPAAMKTVIEAMQQDPDYAWGWHCNIAMSFVDAGGDHYTGNQGAARFMRTLANVEPAHELPFSPPQRTWVGLTDEEKKLLWVDFNDWNARMLIDVVEAKLKEKNT